jgi:SRSO17 transposase
MTEQEIAALGPAFAAEIRTYRGCFQQDRTALHFDTYCRGLLADLPRKTVEPIALAAGTAVRTLQEFLTTAVWDHSAAQDQLHRRMAQIATTVPGGDVGTIGVIDETSCTKKGDKTPGVQRQYLGCVGKIDNGIVTVHVGLTRGSFQALLDADLYLPKSWAEDRDRCRAAGIPDTVRYRSKWRIALDQLLRLSDNGVSFDWLVFDEGYGSKVPFLWVLGRMGQKFVAEVPVNFAVRASDSGASQRADRFQPGTGTESWVRFRLTRKTLADQVWRAKGVRVWVARGWHTLVTAVNEATGEVKYFVTNASDSPMSVILGVAFRRATIGHTFRVAKQEAGLMHYEGRDYTGLIRHLTLSLIVLGFVAAHTERLRGEKSASDPGTSVPGVECEVRGSASSSSGRGSDPPHKRGDRLSSAA